MEPVTRALLTECEDGQKIASREKTSVVFAENFLETAARSDLRTSPPPCRSIMSTISAYELERLNNIARNREKLIALGIETDVQKMRSEAKVHKPVVKGAAQNKKRKTDMVPPRQRSLRLQNLDAEGKPLPDREVLPSPTPEPVMKKQRKSSLTLDAAKVSTGATSADEAVAFLSRLGALSMTRSEGATPLSTSKANGKQGRKKGSVKLEAAAPPPLELGSLSVSEEDIAKLVPERIFSMEMHPSSTKLLIAAGDTWGRVGLWDVDAGEDAPVATFEPHTRPVAGLRVLPNAPHQLLSCSHDGAIRCLNLEGGAACSFVEVYRSPEDKDGDYPSLHGLSRTVGEGGALAVCRSDGMAVLLDPRVAPSAGVTAPLHDKKLFSLDFSPTRPWLLASASLDRTVAVWDVRKISPKKNKPLATMEHGLSVTAARFSPRGTRLLTTCNDDMLRVFEGGESTWDLARAVKHNNHTGRYLTPFQAEWQRDSDEMFLSGSLEHPRGIDVFRVDGAPMERLEDDNVSAVISLVACHPTHNVLAGSNASGKVYLWR
jgi:hypothetical protein